MENDYNQKFAVSLQTVIVVMLIIVFACSIVFLSLMPGTAGKIAESGNTTDAIVQLENNVFDMKRELNELNELARTYIVTENVEEAVLYSNELETSEMKRANPTLLENTVEDETARLHLISIADLRRQLMEEQCYAIRLVMQANGVDPQNRFVYFRDVKLSGSDLRHMPDEQRWIARQRLFGESYNSLLIQMERQIALFKQRMMVVIENSQLENSEALLSGMKSGRQLVLIMFGILLASMIFMLAFVVQPIYRLIFEIRYGTFAEVKGADEIRYLASTYNHFRGQMDNVKLKLSYEASHDALTGLYNRSAYDEYSQLNQKRGIALILIDVDLFKRINDEFGHEAGDRVLTRVGKVLKRTFRESDKVFRVGGDEFAIILVGVASSRVNVLRDKIADAAKILSEPEKDTPGVTLSVGVAFSDQVNDRRELFKAADRALYMIKRNGRNGCGFYKA
ncbi:MAG: GGDEF domain-containing protein [Clostridia bacterium]|nr:GGDEF domain-containing protein [Clostridia bacterium]